MRGTVMLACLALALHPDAIAAQDLLPVELAARINLLLNDAATDLREGDAIVPAGERVAGHLAVLDGDLELAGEVEGDVVVVNGDLRLAPGASVGGEAIVVGGRVEGAGAARIAAGVRASDEPVGHCRRAGIVDVTGRCAPLPEGAAEPPEVGGEGIPGSDLRYLLATGRSYNRVEGLPVRFGLGWEVPGAVRLRVEGIYRTESGAQLGPSRWGYVVGVERELGGPHGVRLGARALSMVDAIEPWHVTDLENSLATFLLRRDFRDHYERQGWSGYLAAAPPGSPWTVSLEVARERHRSLPVGSPWSLVRNDEPWRPQPLVGEGHLVRATARIRADGRSERRDPAAGWFLDAEVEQALSSSLRRVEHRRVDAAMPLPPGGWPLVEAEPFGRFTHLLVDLRRYNRISPWSRLNLRVAGGGALTERGLPPQRQHALGGEGTLPGFPLFGMDCRARDYRAERDPAQAGGGPTYHPAYGCDRFLLGQVEYRSALSLRLPLPGGDGSFERRRVEVSWVLFADAGAGWSAGDRLPDERVAIDVGTGVQWREFGAYVAAPVGARAALGQANFFIRLSPRF